MKDILVTGGLGFIGSHTVVALSAAGYNPIILDNLSNSHITVLDALERLTGKSLVFFKGDVNDPFIYQSLFEQYSIQAVVHFAAHKAVGESVELPLKYYKNNVGGLITLLEGMEKFGVHNMVFSSSCTVYGEPEMVPTNEQESIKPASSPYGTSKQMCEVILKDLTWCNTQCLRYFNPIGAHETALIGELPIGIPNNLIPYLTQTAAGLRQELTIHGGDYPTPDGTCIRDYIHVMDLAEAHVMALNRLLQKKQKTPFETFNIGTGVGYSVLEVIKTFETITEKPFPYKIGPRRTGDIVQVWADALKAKNVLGWVAKRNLTAMLKDAWKWQQTLT
jgi:UDP-glucose 4-epimerase